MAPSKEDEMRGGPADCCTSDKAKDDGVGKDLAKYINITRLEDGKDSSKKEHTGKAKMDDAIALLKDITFAKNAGFMQVVGNNVWNKRIDHRDSIRRPTKGLTASSDDKSTEERLGWASTNWDRTKDLASVKITIGSDCNEDKIQKKFELATQMATLPFHTLLVQWRLHYNFPVYTPRVVHAILSRFGKIDHMASMSPNSALVIFHYQYHASKAVTARDVGFSYCPVMIRWWYLERYQFPIADADDVKREDLLTSEGRLERNSKRHMAQIKREFWKKAANLSYDVSSFRP